MAQGAEPTLQKIDLCARNARDERDDVGEQAYLRLVEEAPEVANHGGAQHHRNQNDRGPEGVPTELAIDQVGKAEPDECLERDGPEHKVSGGLHGDPDVAVAQDALIVGEADILDDLIGAVGAIVREAQPDRPQQREDVNRQKKYHGRGDEQPGQRSVGQSAKPFGDVCRR